MKTTELVMADGLTVTDPKLVSQAVAKRVKHESGRAYYSARISPRGQLLRRGEINRRKSGFESYPFRPVSGEVFELYTGYLRTFRQRLLIQAERLLIHG